MTDGFEELDRKLSQANLARAVARKAIAVEATAEQARRHDAAGDEADRLGELYLRARFDHEARQAGLYVDDSVFEVPGVDPGFIDYDPG